MDHPKKGFGVHGVIGALLLLLMLSGLIAIPFVGQAYQVACIVGSEFILLLGFRRLVAWQKKRERTMGVKPA